jgi:hypothetical protein
MDKEIEKAVNLVQRLRAVMLQVVALEKEIEEWDTSDEKMMAVVDDMREVMHVFATEGMACAMLKEDTSDILAQIDTLLYSLLDLSGDGDTWADESEFEKRTQLKLGEAVRDRMLLQTSLSGP